MVEKSNNHLRDELARLYQHVQVQREAPYSGLRAAIWVMRRWR